MSKIIERVRARATIASVNRWYRENAEMAAVQNVNFKCTVDTGKLNKAYTSHRWWAAPVASWPQNSKEATQSDEIISNTTTKTMANVGIWPLIDAMQEKASRKWWQFWR
jgi:hypothetical protein